MSHEIEEIDLQEGRKDAWHHKTKINLELRLDNCWPTTWEYERRALVTETGVKTPFFAMGVTDHPEIVVGKPFADSYQFVKNHEWIEGLQEALKESDVVLESVGTIQNRARRFFSFSSKQLQKMEFGKHKIYSHFFIVDSIDKSTNVIFGLWSKDIVCANTFKLALQNGRVKARLVHSKNLKFKLDGLLETVSEVVGFQASVKAEFEKLMEMPANEQDARNFYAGITGTGGDGGKGATMINRLTALFAHGAGNEGRSRYDILSGATDYYSHESAGRKNATKQYISSEFGPGQAMKEKVYNHVRINELFADTVAKGKLILAGN